MKLTQRNRCMLLWGWLPPTADTDLLLDAPHVFPAELRWRSGEPPPRIMLARRARMQR